MQKLKMLPAELKVLPPGQSITEYRSLMCKYWNGEVAIRHFGSPGSVLPLKERCEILDVTYQESNILELSKPNPLHISEVTNEVTPSASFCELAVGSVWCATDSRPKIRIPIERQKHTENEILMSATSKSFTT